jgi:hypothetical protein
MLMAVQQPRNKFLVAHNPLDAVRQAAVLDPWWAQRQRFIWINNVNDRQ